MEVPKYTVTINIGVGATVKVIEGIENSVNWYLENLIFLIVKTYLFLF